MMPTHPLPRLSAITLTCTLFGFAIDVRAASVEEASKVEIKAATDAFEQGVQALDTEHFQQALDHFQRSYDTVASPNSRMMVGRSLIRLGRLPEAYQVLSQTIADVNANVQAQKKYKKTLETAQNELDEIKPKLSFIRVRPAARVSLQGKEIESSTWATPHPVAPGTVTLELTLADGRKVQKQLTLKPGEVTEFVADAPEPVQAPPPAPAPKPELTRSTETGAISRKTAGFVLGAVGIVGVGVFVGVGLVGASSYGDSHADCTPQICPSSAVDNEGSKSLMKGIGYTGLGVGVLGLGAATWLLLSDGASSPSTAIGIGPGRLQLQQRF